ncbi:hypothetical protein B0H11DRAFT_2189976 [Mycena galericulata]|nr:hypothetical protein B0H11DRAFT_2189976 [Mycena galericulata]
MINVWPPMAPLIIFPATERPKEYTLQHYTHAVRAGDLELLQKSLPSGGCLITVHEPTDAASWIEANYDHPLLHLLHERGISGPFPMMLSAYTQGLAVFGVFDDPRAMQLILRPRAEDPAPKFLLSKSSYEGKGKDLSSAGTSLPLEDDDLLDRNAIFRSLDQGHIQAFTKLEVGTNGAQISVDTAYASLGFEGHQRRSLHSCKYLPGGNDTAKQIYTQATQEHVETSKGTMAGDGKSEGSFQHRRNQSRGIEATRDKFAPDWIVHQQLGNRFNEEKKSYISIATSYKPHNAPFDNVPKPLDVNVVLSLELTDPENRDEVQISFIDRTQIHIWVSPFGSRSVARGAIFILSNYVPNIRTERALMITEDEVHVDISATAGSSAKLSRDSFGSEENRQDDLPVTAVPEILDFSTEIQKPATAGNPPSATSTLPMQLQELWPCVTGWDEKNKCWLSPIWPNLDEGLRAVDAFRPEIEHPNWKRCWKLEPGCQ